MYCVKCGKEYGEKLKRCCCGGRLEKGPPKSYRELVEIYSTWKNVEAGFLKSLLDSSGIESYIHNLYYPSIVPVGTGAVPIKIMVPADDAENRERAEEIIKEHIRNT